MKPSVIFILFGFILASCNLPGANIPSTKTSERQTAGTLGSPVTKQPPTFITLARTMALTASPMSTPFPPNTPVWSAYHYTCEYTDGGGDMTMNLAWSDRSSSEEGYRIYRDKLVIATLNPDSTFYVDVAFVATGMSLSYSVEAFGADWDAGSSVITYGCQ